MNLKLLFLQGGRGSGNHGHEGRPGQVGGSLKSVGKKDYNILASEYVRIHNEASKEYKKAFKKVGVRMWHDDDAHPIPKENIGFIANGMKKSLNVYKNLSVPLTVLDSYPDVTKNQRKWLEKEVNKIASKYQKQWLSIVQ